MVNTYKIKGLRYIIVRDGQEKDISRLTRYTESDGTDVHETNVGRKLR